MAITKEEVSWWDRFFETHKQTHIYWSLMSTVPLLLVGWSLTNSQKIEEESAILAVVFITLLQALSTLGLVRMYGFFRSSHQELKIQNKEKNQDGPFAFYLENYTPWPNWFIYLAGVIAWVFCCFVIYLKIA